MLSKIKELGFIPKTKIRALVIADTHNHLTREDLVKAINNEHIDLIITLGDISFNDWAILLENEIFLSLPKFGVLGNHDDWIDIDNVNIKILLLGNPLFKIIIPLHNNPQEFMGLNFIGLDGSVKYKNIDVPLFTQKEAMDIMDYQQRADILISHNGLKQEEDITDTLSRDAHDGFYAIWAYMNKHHCFIHIHGHMHKPGLKKIGRYQSKCIHKLEVINISKSKIK